jgi:hypothetical protein
LYPHDHKKYNNFNPSLFPEALVNLLLTFF